MSDAGRGKGEGMRTEHSLVVVGLSFWSISRDSGFRKASQQRALLNDGVSDSMEVVYPRSPFAFFKY